MLIKLSHKGILYSVELNAGIDLSIPVSVDGKINAYYAPAVKMEPFVMGDWIGEVAKGAPVNYRNISFNPHGNGTHTECVGHIDQFIHSVNQNFNESHSIARLLSIEPVETAVGDRVIHANQIPNDLTETSVIIRTLPNDVSKRERNYSGTNPAYLHHEAIQKLVDQGCQHLILDLPSVDKEQDEGKLLGHRAFWNHPKKPRMHCSITELAVIPDTVADGIYFLNLQVAPFENDAAPSRPIIYPMLLI